MAVFMNIESISVIVLIWLIVCFVAVKFDK